jgi:hypothetical protein
MKQPPKPFSIEIKRSRRPPTVASPMDFFGKDNSAGAGAGFLSRRDSFSAPAGASELSIPAFLQSERPSARAAQLTQEAAQLFTPKAATPAAPSADQRNGAETRPKPRILPSLVPPDGAALYASAQADAAPPPARQSRRPKAAARKAADAKTDRAEKATAKRRDGSGAQAGATDIRAKRKPSVGRSAAPAPASPAPIATQSAAESNAAPSNGVARAGRVRIFARRGRENAAALPPGQHWKRRLNPRAW